MNRDEKGTKSGGRPTMYSGFTLTQSLLRPLRIYSESGCFRMRPSPLVAMTSSILCLTSLAVLPSNSVTNSIRPGISCMQARRFRFRNLRDFLCRDMPLRYSKSNTLTEKRGYMGSTEPKNQTTYNMVLDGAPLWTCLGMTRKRFSREKYVEPTKRSSLQSTEW